MGYRATRAMDTLPHLYAVSCVYSHSPLHYTLTHSLLCPYNMLFTLHTHTNTHFDIHISTFPKPSLQECTCPPFPFRACGEAFPFDPRF